MPDTPQYAIRVSMRARHASLRASVRDGLVVVVPVSFDPARIPALLARHAAWVERALRRIARQRHHALPETLEAFPTVLELRAIGEQWSVELHPTRARSIAARSTVRDGQRIVRLSGPVHHRRKARTAITAWLQRRAAATLIPQLHALARETGLQPTAVRVRGAATRWGSCSHANAISLNRKLLFLPQELMRMVLLHELCHTVEHNHGPRFWALLEQYEPLWKPLRRELRTAWRYVPAWADAPR